MPENAGNGHPAGGLEGLKWPNFADFSDFSASKGCILA
jgi:hypothetical protein